MNRAKQPKLQRGNIFRTLSSSSPSYSLEFNGRGIPKSKNNCHLGDERTRVLQKNLVFANGLPHTLQNKEMLKNDIYFGRYGKVTKLILNENQGQRKQSYCQAYITYQTQLQASLAIVALDGLNYNERPLKVSYGTNKYCSSFIKGYECQNPDCYYLHKFDERREIKNGTKNGYRDKNDEAFDIVCENLEYVVQRMMDEEGRQQGFPTFTQMVDFLLESNFTTQREVQRLRKKYEYPKLKQTISSPPQLLSHDSSPKEVRKSKSNSFSTVGSPSKQIENEEKIEQNLTANTSFNLQQAIEQMIIKRLFRTIGKQPRSRLNFVKSDKTHTSELLRLRSIVQRHLIGNN